MSIPPWGVFTQKNQLSYARLGIVVSRKAIPKATARNQVKRIIRESFRQKQSLLGNRDIVMVVYKGADQLEKQVQRDKVEQVWTRLIEK